MKKLLSFTLALVMMLSVSVTAFAGTVDQDSIDIHCNHSCDR